jgi:hypothetical protein
MSIRFDNMEVCYKCQDWKTVHLAGDKLSKINERTLPAWTKCRCGWNEITTAELTRLAKWWRDALTPDDNVDDDEGSIEETIEDLKKIVGDVNENV